MPVRFAIGVTERSRATDSARSRCSIWGFSASKSFANPQQNELLGARNQNVLAAVNLSTGEIQWEVGGTRADRKNRDHAGTFFLGSGLPLESALYCLGELDGEISLIKLDPATGKTAWAQRLAVPLGRLPHFPLRRLAGDNPSYASGLLICPTSAGVVAAVDPSSRHLALGISLSHQCRRRPARSADAVGRRAALYGNRREFPLA